MHKTFSSGIYWQYYVALRDVWSDNVYDSINFADSLLCYFYVCKERDKVRISYFTVFIDSHITQLNLFMWLYMDKLKESSNHKEVDNLHDCSWSCTSSYWKKPEVSRLVGF